MKYLIALLLGLAIVAPHPAAARTHVSLSFGYGGYWPTYYEPYWSGPAYYVPPRPVYYVPPPVRYYAPPVTYYAPPVRTVYQPVETVYVPAPAPSAMPATQTSPTYVDSRGRTCRHFETTVGGDRVLGTACLFADGTWRTVQ